MFGSTVPELLVAQIIFWVLLPVTLFAPTRWAVLAWLIMGNLDVTEPGFASATQFGWINVAKGLCIPFVLYLRFRAHPSQALASLSAKFWIALAAYGAIAALWTPFPLAAVKLVGSILGILLTIVVLEKAARAGILSRNILALYMVVTLLLGVVQTYYFGGMTYGYDGPDQHARFSSFIHAQQYAAILVAFVALVLWHREFTTFQRFSLGVGTLVALGLNGSRTWFLGAAIMVIVYCCVSFRRAALVAAFGLASAFLAGLVISNLLSWDVDLLGEAPNRLLATSKALVSGEDTAQRAGLRNFSFRIIVYEGVIDELRSASPREIVLGHGTSSGGQVSLRLFPHVYNADNLDPNRTIHNEWLRALYEWGLTGLFLLAGTFVTLIAGVTIAYRKARYKSPFLALLSFLPAFITALSTENILAGVGNAVTFSLALLIALQWVPAPSLGFAREPVGSPQELAGNFALEGVRR